MSLILHYIDNQADITLNIESRFLRGIGSLVGV
jgi:hypothetical protein